MKALLSIAALSAALTPALQAQSVKFDGDARNTVVVQNEANGGGVTNPLYLPPATDNNYSGVVNLWFRNSSGAVVSGCTGALLSTRKILTAGHCVSTGTNAISFSSFTARFRNADGTYTEVNGTGVVVQQNYSGAVIEEQDVAVLTLAADAPKSARTYSLFSGNPLQDFTLAGYGRIGTGDTGDNTSSGQFNAINTLRAARNRFESTGNDATSFATNANPNPGAFGGVLLADFDPPTGAPTSFMCASLGFCTNGAGTLEGAVGRGDSGGSAFTSTWEILGVASWGQSNSAGNINPYGAVFGYACVANFAANAVCKANYDFVQAQLATTGVVPEPSTYMLMGTGLLGLAGIARRRRN